MCLAGRYLADNGTLASLHDSSEKCSSCPPGTYLSDNGKNGDKHDDQDDCIICASGKYTALEASSYCFNCSVGRFLRDKGQNRSLHDETTDCRICPKGFYSDLVGMSKCKACSAGKYLEYDERYEYEQFHTSEHYCSTCEMGTYSPYKNASTCIRCPSGTYLDDDGANHTNHDENDDCISCPAMTYNPSSGSGYAWLCSSCTSGKVSIEGSQYCEECEPGKYANTSSGTCDNCTFGRYTDVSGSVFCTICLAGYHVENEHRSCVQCHAGTSSEIGTEVCESCPGGKYSLTGSSECIDCDKGKFAPDGGAASCDKCSAEMGQGYTSATGETTCSLSTEDYYMDFYNIPRTCPHGFKCAEGSNTLNIVLNKGYYRFSQTSVTAYKCKFWANCQGGLFNTTPCVAGSSGHMCYFCKNGFYMTQMDNSDGCSECTPSSGLWYFPFAILILLLSCVLICFKRYINNLREKNKKRLEHMSQRATVAFMTCQCIVILHSNHYEVGGQQVGKPYSDFLHAIQFITFDVVDIVPISCIFESNISHYELLLFETLLPILFLILGKVLVLLFSKFSREKFTANFMNAIIIVLPVISKRICNTLRCVSYDGGEDDDLLLLVSDLNTDCRGNKYVVMKIYSLCMMILFPIGVPLSLGIMLWKCKHLLYPSEVKNGELSESEFILSREKNSKLEKKPITIFASMYRPKYYWFESWSLIRRIALTNGAVLCGTLGQTTLFTFSIATFSLIFEREARPYASPFMRWFTHLMSWEILLFIFYMLILDAQMSSGIETTIISSIMLILNVFVIGVVGWDNRYIF